MFSWFKRDTTLQREIDRVHADMQMLEVGSEPYNEKLKAYERLTLLTINEKTSGVSPDTKAIIIGNLVLAALIIGYENAHVITTRAITMFLKHPKG